MRTTVINIMKSLRLIGAFIGVVALLAVSPAAYSAIANVGTANTTGPATSGAQVSDTNITTVASDYATIALGFYNGATGQHPTSVTLDGQAATFIIAADSTTSTQMVALYYVKGYSVGAGKVVAYTNPSAQSSGVGIAVTFYTGGDIASDTTSLIRDSDSDANGGDTSTTPTLTAQSGDMAVAAYGADVGSATPSPGSEVAVNAATGTQTGIIEFSPTGNTTMSVTSAGNAPSIVAIIMKPTGGATHEQEGFRWGVDDGNEASHTFEASQDTNISITDNQSRLLRTLVNATGDTASTAYTLRYQKNGAGGYTAVPVGSTTASSISNQNVAASADDGQEVSGGTNTITGTTIGASLDSTAEWAGMRFTNITIPAGATITSASVGVVPSGTGEDEPLVTVFLEAADNCAAYTTGASNISGRSRGTGVSWSSADLGANGSTYFSTPDLAAAVQAVVDRGGWASGNALCVHIQGGATGTRDLTIEAQDLGPNTNPPRLSVAWTTPNQVYVTTSANITASGEATTARLTAPGAKSTSDFVTGRRWDDENGSDSIDITTDDYTEVEWLVFVAASAADSDYFDFRTYAGSAALDTYTVTPRWTIPSAGGGTIVNPISGRGGAAASPIIN